MFYLRRMAETLLLSIICSLPEYLVLLGFLPEHSMSIGRLQMLFFCLFILITILIQNAVHQYDNRRKYYILLSIFSYIPYTLLTVILYFLLPQNIYQLFFMPMVFLDWMGVNGIMSVILMNLIMYLSIPLSPWLKQILKNRNI